jgi:hypothetical protein
MISQRYNTQERNEIAKIHTLSSNEIAMKPHPGKE